MQREDEVAEKDKVALSKSNPAASSLEFALCPVTASVLASDHLMLSTGYLPFAWYIGSGSLYLVLALNC